MAVCVVIRIVIIIIIIIIIIEKNDLESGQGKVDHFWALSGVKISAATGSSVGSR